MRIFVLFTLLISAAAQAAPATVPASQPTATEPLVGGALRYAPPAGWDLSNKREDGHGANYKEPSGKGVIMILAVPLSAALPKNAGEQMAPQIGKGIRDAAVKDGNTILIAPKVIPDDRFVVKIHDRQKLKEGQISDRVQVYQGFGVYLVSVTSYAFTDDDAAAGEVHKLAEKLLDQIRISRGVRPTIFARTQIKLLPPVDWKEQKLDRLNGPTATYTDERNPANKIIIRAKIIPRATQADPAKRQVFLDKMIDEERQTEPYTPARISADETPLPADNLLRKLHGAADDNGRKLSVISRYLPIGDVLVSVRSISPESEAEAVIKIADELAATIKPPRD